LATAGGGTLAGAAASVNGGKVSTPLARQAAVSKHIEKLIVMPPAKSQMDIQVRDSSAPSRRRSLS